MESRRRRGIALFDDRVDRKAIMGLQAAQAAQAPAFCRWRAWGTTVVVGVLPAWHLARARAIVRSEIRAMDAACSRFAGGSELTVLNRSCGQWVQVSALLGEVLDVAVDAAEHTGGAVDPTTARSLELLGSTSEATAGDPGDPVLPLGGPPLPAGRWRSVHRHPSGRAVRLASGVHLDLGAIATALCADRAAAKVVEELGGGVMVHVGRDAAAAGTAPDGGWRVGIVDRSRGSSPEGDCIVVVRTGGVANACPSAPASLAGTPHCRTADLVTSLPTASVWRMVTVAASSCVDARIAVNAVTVWGDPAVHRLHRLGVSARLVTRHGEVLELGGWPDRPAAGCDGSGGIILATA
ncbi:MAG: FAD:protein FMN transferase [Acidimicrobiales bacterium]